jgi:HEAT repeat protein
MSSSLDTFRTVLDHLDDGERSHQLLFFRALHAAAQDAVQELSLRAQKTTSSRGLRQLALEASFYYPWPEWVPMLARMLRHEPDLYLFGIGLHALGRIGDASALATLRELSKIRVAAEFQKMVAEIMAQTDPAEAFQYHLSCLLEGSANPSAANKAAHQLEELVNEESLEPLKNAILHPDLLVFRQALRLIALIPSRSASDFLAEFLEECHCDLLEDRELKEILPAFRGLTRNGLLEEVIHRLAPRFEKRDPESIEVLKSQVGPAAMKASERLKEQASGKAEEFLTKLLAATLENNPTRIQAVLTETGEEIHLRARRLTYAMDTAAEGLARMVQLELFPLEKAVSILEHALQQGTGREGLVHAFTLLVPADAPGLLDLVILNPEGSLRAVAVETLGERKEEALRPALLKASRDSITDIAQRALFHLGQLPESETLARELLHSLSLDEIQLGLSFIGMHKLQSLIGDLVEMVRSTNREELSLRALEALGSIGSTQAAAPLLELLHSGQAPRLQLALAQALRDLNDPDSAHALCGKADELRNPQIHTLAVEALCRAHATPEQALDSEGGQYLLEQTVAAWYDKNPWGLRLRVVIALKNVILHSPEQWSILSALLQEALAEKRAPGAWSMDELGQFQSITKELGNRARA